MDDATTPPFPPEVPATGTQTKTETTIETIETQSGAKGRRAGELLGMSGRFWISMVALMGLIYLCNNFGSILITAITENKDLTVAQAFLGMIFSAYAGAVTTVLGNYMGQNAGPTKPKPS